MKFFVKHVHDTQEYIQLFEFKSCVLRCIIDDKAYAVSKLELISEKEVKIQLIHHECIHLKQCDVTQLEHVLLASYAAYNCSNMSEERDGYKVMIFLLQLILYQN